MREKVRNALREHILKLNTSDENDEDLIGSMERVYGLVLRPLPGEDGYEDWLAAQREDDTNE